MGISGSDLNVLYCCYICVGTAEHKDPNYYLCDRIDPETGNKQARVSAAWLARRRRCTGRTSAEDDAACEKIVSRILKHPSEEVYMSATHALNVERCRPTRPGGFAQFARAKRRRKV